MNAHPDFSVGVRRVCLVLAVAACIPDAAAQWVTTHDPLFQGVLARPAAGTMVSDPHFNTHIRRISDARAAGLPGVMPQYAKRQAWNANDSLLLLITGHGATLLFDARTLAFLRELPVGGEDVFWHPVFPNLIVATEGSEIFSYDVATDARARLLDFPEFAFVNTRGEGNLSNDGRRYAFVGQTYDSTTHFKEIVVCDLEARSVLARLSLPNMLEDFDWVSISPLGTHVVVDYATLNTGRFQGVEVYDAALNFLWQKPLGSGHSDIAVDASGAELLVMGYYDPGTNRGSVRAWPLDGGAERTLVEHEWSLYTHISCRNTKRPGWCFISTYDGEGRLEDDSASWLPFEDEIFAARLDGSGGVQRIAHHRSKRFTLTTPDSDNSVYYAEPHATVNAAGTRVLFGSNWRMRVESDSSVDAYIAEFGHLLGADAAAAPEQLSLLVYPNPSRGELTVQFRLDAGGPVDVTLHDMLGREVHRASNGQHLASGRHSTAVSLGDARPGIYLVRLASRSGSAVARVVVQ